MDPRELRRQEEQDATRTVRRRAAVTAATDLFAQRGFHATSMADVAKAGGLSLKALYQTFPSKETLFEAVLAEVGNRFAVLLQAPEEADDPADWLLRFVDRLVELLAENTSALRLYSRGADGIPTALRAGGVDPFAGFMVRVLDVLSAAVRDVQARGGAVDMDARVLARSILNMTVAEARHRLEAGERITDAAAELSPIVAAFLRPVTLPETPRG